MGMTEMRFRSSKLYDSWNRCVHCFWDHHATPTMSQAASFTNSSGQWFQRQISASV
jgi:hypothetical protein